MGLERSSLREKEYGQTDREKKDSWIKSYENGLKWRNEKLERWRKRQTERRKTRNWSGEVEGWKDGWKWRERCVGARRSAGVRNMHSYFASQ